MPQMAPMSWTFLFLFFTTSLIIFSIMNYYSFIPMIKPVSKTETGKMETQNWKW
uniref:ATP synthase complex subunit 8 n=1 Tax=Ictinogomphus sp. MT-2014 TaxID=1560015 RepID=A0A0A0V9W2_9ODON|nr:ATP synthase F0 subunit 8 [Ictinogomphus sp. MT-2014]